MRSSFGNGPHPRPPRVEELFQNVADWCLSALRPCCDLRSIVMVCFGRGGVTPPLHRQAAQGDHRELPPRFHLAVVPRIRLTVGVVDLPGRRNPGQLQVLHGAVQMRLPPLQGPQKVAGKQGVHR